MPFFYRPDTATYIEKLEAMKNEKAEGKDNRTFLAKYVSKVILFILVSSITCLGNAFLKDMHDSAGRKERCLCILFSLHVLNGGESCSSHLRYLLSTLDICVSVLYMRVMFFFHSRIAKSSIDLE